jgi:hypothetical protein
MDHEKAQSENVEQCNAVETTHQPAVAVSKGEPLMRSNLDDLGIWEGLLRYKTVTMIAMAAAFSAALDGYRMMPYPWFLSTFEFEDG